MNKEEIIQQEDRMMYCGFCNSSHPEDTFEEDHRRCYEANMAKEFGPGFLSKFENAPKEEQRKIYAGIVSMHLRDLLEILRMSTSGTKN